MTKTNGLILFAALALFSFSSCKKSSPSVPASTWTLASINYTAQYTLTAEADDPDDADDGKDFTIDASAANGDNVASITFKDQPTKSGTYTVIPFSGNIGTSPTSCFILGYTSTLDVESIGKSGDVVNVTVSGGTITATFSNITTEDRSTSAIKTMSGTLAVQP